MIIEKLQKFYRAGSVTMWENILALPEIRVFEHGDVAVAVSVENVDMAVTKNETSQPYISFDDVIDLNHLAEVKSIITSHPQFRWEENALPKLMFDLKSYDYEHYRKKVKTTNTYTIGAKYQAITHTIKDVSNCDLTAIVQFKKEKYPELDLEYIKFNQQYDNATWKLLVGEVNGEFLYEMLCCTSDKRIYGVLVNVSDSADLKSRYKPYVVAHLETLKLGYELSCPVADFGLFFPYKEIFGVEPTWYPGLRWA